MSAPSGAGKTSLVNALLETRRRDLPQSLVVSISHTTRTPRPGEVSGQAYHFVSTQEFERRVAAGDFLEHARVFDNYYGTGREQVAAHLAGGRDVLLEIDWQGARQVRQAMRSCVSIFILPPSRAALEGRLRARQTDSDAVIRRRLADAASDMSHCPEFDYAVINDQFERALAELLIITAHPRTNSAAPLRASRPEIQALLTSLVAHSDLSGIQSRPTPV